MEQQRVFLWIGLLLLLWLNVIAWTRDDAAAPQAAPATETTARRTDSGPAAPNSTPAAGALTDELPSVAGEAPATTTAVTPPTEAPPPGAGKIRVVTDVLDLEDRKSVV